MALLPAAKILSGKFRALLIKGQHPGSVGQRAEKEPQPFRVIWPVDFAAEGVCKVMLDAHRTNTHTHKQNKTTNKNT